MTSQTPSQIVNSISATARLKLYELMLHPSDESAARMNIRRWLTTEQITETEAEWLIQRVKEANKCDCG